MLGRIEGMYGSVAEYYRCMEEADEREAELQHKAQLKYRENKEKLDKAEEKGLSVVYYADGCVGCDSYESIGMTDEYDDVEHGICMKCGKCENKK